MHNESLEARFGFRVLFKDRQTIDNAISAAVFVIRVERMDTQVSEYVFVVGAADHPALSRACPSDPTLKLQGQLPAFEYFLSKLS